MADRKVDRKYTYYICGWCGSEIMYQVTDKPTVPCPACGWWHKDKHRYNDVPSEFKIDLTNPTIS